MYNLVVVGAGVAGLMAATRAAQCGASVLLLEKMEKPARKLRITGKGRCNITNGRPRDEFLEKIRNGREFFEAAFDMFDNRATLEFFESIGLPITLERGDRAFPSSGKAWDVADALVRCATSCGVEIRCHCTVIEIHTDDRGQVCGLSVRGADNKITEVETTRIVLTTGGVSYPSTGSTGQGHQMADELGLRIEPLRPALVPLMVDAAGLSGLLLKNIQMSLLVDGNVAEERFGEAEFTSDRVLGGAITLQVSRTAVDAVIDGRRVEVAIDMKSALSVAKLQGRFEREIKELGPKATVRILLGRLLPAALRQRVATQADVSLAMPLNRMGEREALQIIGAIKALTFKIEDYRPFTEAIITAGGVALDEIDPQTMECRRLPGLYIAGELLDIDADTGGYNIQIALSTGRRAGEAAATSL